MLKARGYDSLCKKKLGLGRGYPSPVRLLPERKSNWFVLAGLDCGQYLGGDIFRAKRSAFNSGFVFRFGSDEHIWIF